MFILWCSIGNSSFAKHYFSPLSFLNDHIVANRRKFCSAAEQNIPNRSARSDNHETVMKHPNSYQGSLWTALENDFAEILQIVLSLSPSNCTFSCTRGKDRMWKGSVWVKQRLSLHSTLAGSEHFLVSPVSLVLAEQHLQGS